MHIQGSRCSVLQVKAPLSSAGAYLSYRSPPAGGSRWCWKGARYSLIPLVCSRTSVGERAHKHCSWTASWDQRERSLQRWLQAEAAGSLWEEAEKRREQRSLVSEIQSNGVKESRGTMLRGNSFQIESCPTRSLLLQRRILLVGKSAAESSESTGSVAACDLVAGFPELEYRDWLCCWWGCVGMGCDSAAASEEAEESLWWWEEEEEEECGAPWGSDTRHHQKEVEQGSFGRLKEEPEPHRHHWGLKRGRPSLGLPTGPAAGRWMRTGRRWSQGWRSSWKWKGPVHCQRPDRESCLLLQHLWNHLKIWETIWSVLTCSVLEGNCNQTIGWIEVAWMYITKTILKWFGETQSTYTDAKPDGFKGSQSSLTYFRICIFQVGSTRAHNNQFARNKLYFRQPVVSFRAQIIAIGFWKKKNKKKVTLFLSVFSRYCLTADSSPGTRLAS